VAAAKKGQARHLRKRSIDAAKYEGDGKSRCVLWDNDPHGLGLRIYPPNAKGETKKAFVLSYRFKGRKRLMVLGRYGADITLDQARNEARDNLKLAREGTDPLVVKQRQAQGSSLRDLVSKYIEEHAKPHKRTWRDDERRLDRLIPAAWLSRDVTDVSREDITSLHQKIGAKTPYEANRLLEVLRLMFKFGRLWGFLPEGSDNPAADVKKFKETKRKVWLKPEELPEVAKAIDAETNIYGRAAIWLYLLTGLRKSELTNAKWDDVDWRRASLRLPDTKSGEEQMATLNAAAIAILQALPKVNGNPHILPGTKAGQPMTNIDRIWRKVREAAELEHVQLHDLRRTAGSWLSQNNVELNKIKDALRHANIATTLTYARLGQDAARDAMEQHGKLILAAAGKDKPGEVVALKR
jgi:integrase